MSNHLLGVVKESISSRFELVAPLTDAGLGEPWSAFDLSANRRPVLVKLLPARPASEPWALVVARLQSLGNPRLPKVIDGAELPDGRRWIAFESVKGRSLTNWLDGHREVGTSPGLGVVQRLFDALSSALQVGHVARPKAVLHRGLTPASVVIEASPGGHIVTLLDHELAAFVDTSATWPYLAPEQREARPQEGAAADVFSLAVIFVELLTLRATPRADSAETWWQLAQRAPRDVRAALASMRSDVPKALWDVIGDALQLDAKKRPRDAQTFASAVRQQSPPAWKRLPMTEREPPAPTRARQSVSTPRAEKRAANVPEGWMAAERRSDAPSAPSAMAGALEVAATGRALVAVEPFPATSPGPSASPAAHATQPAWMAYASRIDDPGAMTLLDDDPSAVGPAFDQGMATLIDLDDASASPPLAASDRAVAAYDGSTQAMAGGGARLRDAAKAMLAQVLSSQAALGAAHVGSQTLPIERADDPRGSASEADPNLTLDVTDSAIKMPPAPTGRAVVASTMVSNIAPHVVRPGVGRAASDRLGDHTVGFEEHNAFGSPHTLDLSADQNWNRTSAVTPSPVTMPVFPQSRGAPLAPLPRVSQPPVAIPVSAERTLPIGIKPGASTDEPPRASRAVLIAAALAAILVITAVVVVALRR